MSSPEPPASGALTSVGFKHVFGDAQQAVVVGAGALALSARHTEVERHGVGVDGAVSRVEHPNGDPACAAAACAAVGARPAVATVAASIDAVSFDATPLTVLAACAVPAVAGFAGHDSGFFERYRRRDGDEPDAGAAAFSAFATGAATAAARAASARAAAAQRGAATAAAALSRH